MKTTIKIWTFLALFIFAANGSVQAQEGFIGEIRMFAGNFAPRNWAFCEGQLIPISKNTALFSILGTTYGGDGRTTFGLPDLRGRVAMGAGNGPGLTARPQGQQSGAETTTLTQNNLPAHNHQTPSLPVDPKSKTTFSTGNNSVLSVGNAPTTKIGSTNSGGGQAINNLQPYTTVRYIICLQGTFPSRN